MSNAIYPGYGTPGATALIGETFPITRTPVYSTIVQQAASGKEARIALYHQARYKWDIPYGYLNHDINVAAADYQALIGFFEARNGSFDSFLYWDVSDNTAVGTASTNPYNGILGTGDGSTTVFPFGRAIGNSPAHLIGAVATSPAPQVYVNASLLGSGNYVINYNRALITFNSAPSAGAILTASFSYYFRVRFDEDSIELSNDIGSFWTAKKVTLHEVYGEN